MRFRSEPAMRGSKRDSTSSSSGEEKGTMAPDSNDHKLKAMVSQTATTRIFSIVTSRMPGTLTVRNGRRQSQDSGPADSRGGVASSTAEPVKSDIIAESRPFTSLFHTSSSANSSSTEPTPSPQNNRKSRKSSSSKSPAMASVPPSTAAPADSNYTHIPSSAAHDFTRTTTSDSASLSSRHSSSERRHSRQRSRDEEARIAALAMLYGIGYPQDSETRKRLPDLNTLMAKPRIRPPPPLVMYPLDMGNDEVEAARKSDRPSLSNNRGPRERPDWTERDECGPHNGGAGRRASMVWPLLKRVVGGRQTRGCEEVGVRDERREDVLVRRMGDTASVLSQGGRTWGCARFMHR